MSTHRSAVIFDLDGTLTAPYLDFDKIRAQIGVEGPILEALERMNLADRRKAEAVLESHERQAAENATLQEGAVEVIAAFRSKGHPVAILTRNRRRFVDLILNNFGIEVDAVRTREDEAIKPSPEPILSICKEVEAVPHLSWMVGDYIHDIESGRAAGTQTVLMIGDLPDPDFAISPDYTIRRLVELLSIICGIRNAEL